MSSADWHACTCDEHVLTLCLDAFPPLSRPPGGALLLVITVFAYVDTPVTPVLS